MRVMVSQCVDHYVFQFATILEGTQLRFWVSHQPARPTTTVPVPSVDCSIFNETELGYKEDMP